MSALQGFCESLNISHLDGPIHLGIISWQSSSYIFFFPILLFQLDHCKEQDPFDILSFCSCMVLWKYCLYSSKERQLNWT